MQSETRPVGDDPLPMRLARLQALHRGGSGLVARDTLRTIARTAYTRHQRTGLIEHLIAIPIANCNSIRSS